MAKKLLIAPTGKLLFEDPGDLMYGEEGGGPTPPAECTICDDTCLDTYYILVNMTSGTCVNACTTLNVTDQAITKVTGKCQWTWVNGDYTYEMTCDADDSKWHMRIWYGGIGNTLCADWVQVSETVFACPPLGSDLEGVWVRESGACFGNFGLSCGTCSDPMVLLTVFDADYAGGNISWCGLTWTQAEVQAGALKCVCPTFYRKMTSYTSGPPYRWYAWHTWNNNNDLIMQRYFSNAWLSATGSRCDGGTATNYLRFRDAGVATLTDKKRWQDTNTGCPPTNVDSSTFQIGAITAVPAPWPGGFPTPVATKYNITATINSPWFSSVTVGGVEYSWQRGGGW